MENPVRMMIAVWAFFALVGSIIGVLVWRTRRIYAGCARWAIANVLFALSLLLYALQPSIPDSIGVVGANAILAVAAILSLEATREYCGLRPRFFPVYAGGVFAVLAVAYLDYAVRNINGRIFVMSAFMAVVAIICSITLLQEWRARHGLGVVVEGGLFATSAVLLMARAIYYFFAPALTDFFAPSRVNGALFVGCASLIACCSIGWKKMIDEQMLLDLKEAETRTVRANSEALEAAERANSMAQQAAAADAARSEFLETVNHEIRNPLGIVVAATELLLDTGLTQEQQECALSVSTGAETALKVSDDLLDLSKIEAGRMVIESSAFDLRSVIEEATIACERVAKRKHIDLVVAYPGGIPQRFRGDANKIRQVVTNLVGTALRFTYSGHVQVAVACEERGAHYAQMRVSVTDSGIGIPQETIGSLLERSSHGPVWASKIQGGAGIGLVVSKKMIELMGGRLHMESQVGKGSKVWLTLPLAVEGASE